MTYVSLSLGTQNLGEFKSVLDVLFVFTVLALAFYAGIFLLAGPANEDGALAHPKDSVLPLLYDDDDDDDYLAQSSDFKLDGEGIAGIVPVSSGSRYGYSGSTGISVQQNVTQQNVCSSNTAYCYNEVDNDFNVNPP